MENYLNENFCDVKPKNSSDEALQRWRKLCWIVKNPKRRFRFTANLTKRSEAEAIRRSNQVRVIISSLVLVTILLTGCLRFTVGRSSDDSRVFWLVDSLSHCSCSWMRSKYTSNVEIETTTS